MPGQGTGPDPDDARLQAQAKAALAHWSSAISSAGGPVDFSPVGDLTGQIGDWEADIGDNNKMALGSGVIEAWAPLSNTVPSPGKIEWSDGTTESAALMSAADALAAIRKDSVQPCPTCRALEVTTATLAARPIDTTRGKATVPVWTFTLAGTSVVITRVAVQRSVTVEPPPWDPTNPPVGISIDRAQISSDDMSLTVSFVGAPDPASKPCGEDYTAEAVESDSAVVVIVHVHRNPTSGGCSLVGFERFATARLAAPLAGRAVLEVGQGLPVVVVPG